VLELNLKKSIFKPKILNCSILVFSSSTLEYSVEKLRNICLIKYKDEISVTYMYYFVLH